MVIIYCYGIVRGFVVYHDGVADRDPYTPADENAARVAAWIEAHAVQRWFVLVQFMDPHRPYQFHPQYDFGPRALDRYDGEVAFTDQAVGSLLAALERLGLSERTVVVVNADHGEAIQESDSDFLGHGGAVLPEIVFVPLLLRWPGGPGGLKFEALCRNLDIMPTVLELLKVEGPAGMKGRSLVTEFRARTKTSPEPAFTMGVLKGPEQVSAIMQGERPEELYQGVVIPAYQRPAVYTLAADRAGREGAPAETARRLMEDLHDFVAEAEAALAGRPAAEAPLLDEKTRASLKALGYLQQ
jgi:hypothetical protein